MQYNKTHNFYLPMETTVTNNNAFHKRVIRGTNILLEGNFLKAFKLIGKQLNSSDTWIGFKRDLEREVQIPKAKINISVRLIKDQDLDFLFDLNGLSLEEKKLVAWQQKIVAHNFKNCYVAVTEEDKPCYMQWLIGPEENNNIVKAFRGLFPKLKNNQMLLEGAYVHPSFRGLRIMPDAMCKISEMAKTHGAKQVITFVGLDNVPSLKGCNRCGFAPYTLLKREWWLMKRHVAMETIPADILGQYKELITRRK